MSAVLWDGDNLIQKVGQNTEELGHVKLDEHSNEYVLWLKDTRNVFGSDNTYVRGDTFPSMNDAKERAASSRSAWLFHYMWLIGLQDSAASSDGTIAQAIADAKDGKPLKESTFKKEMKKLDESLRKERKFARRCFFVGLALALVGIIISVI